jgi:hypothetical protein
MSLLILKETGQLCTVKDIQQGASGILVVLKTKTGEETRRYLDEESFKKEFAKLLVKNVLVNDSIPATLCAYDVTYLGMTEHVCYRFVVIGKTLISLHDTEYDLYDLEHNKIEPYALDPLEDDVPVIIMESYASEI